MYVERLTRKQFEELALQLTQSNSEEKVCFSQVIQCTKIKAYAEIVVKSKTNEKERGKIEFYDMNDYQCCQDKEISEKLTKIFREYLTSVYGEEYTKDAKAYDDMLEANRNFNNIK